MLEKWEAGSAEPPHSHQGDDMTVVIEGSMDIQFFTKDPKSGALIKDGDIVTLNAGDTGYITSGRIHDAKYTSDCKLVYVHDRAFSFEAH